MTSYMMEHHQKNIGGNGRIMSYLTAHFQLPKDFPALVYLSQVLEAEALRVGVEHWRTLWPQTAGALYWQLDDCWPVASWASIDYYGRWKAAHYAARRFFAPLLLAGEQQGTTVSLAVHNDTALPYSGPVRWSLETLDGEPVQRGDLPVTVEPFAVQRLPPLDLAAHVTEENNRAVVLVCELGDGASSTRCVVPFVPSKHLSLRDPGLAATSHADEAQLTIEITAQSLARFVAVSLEGTDVVFSDNYFDLPAGRPRQITAQLPPGWTVEMAQATLRLQSLFDSYTVTSNQ
jgi:beta-mannosidase